MAKEEYLELEEFLFSSSNRIDGLKVYREPEVQEYDFLVIEFENRVNKIRKDLVANYSKMYRKLGNTETEDNVEAKPFKNLGKAKNIELKVDSLLLNNDDEISELLEKIIIKIYEKYNFLILPSSEEDIEEIEPSDYIVGRNYDLVATQNKAVTEKLYAISFKIKALNKSNNVTDYFPFKLYFRVVGQDNNFDIVIASEFNEEETATGKKGSLFNKKVTARSKAQLQKFFANTDELDKDRVFVNKNITIFITKLLTYISKYVEDFDNAPEWFVNSEFGKYIKKSTLITAEPEIEATASFRYITQTPLPYQYQSVRIKNIFGNIKIYDIKKGSSDNKFLNDNINKCPICGRSINDHNKLVTSNEYLGNKIEERNGERIIDEFVGCQACMIETCETCKAPWSEKKEPTMLDRISGRNYYYKAGKCNSDICLNASCYGSNLCSLHSKRCFDSRCYGRIYCSKKIVKCSNDECFNSFCLEHENDNLFKCECSVCSKGESTTQYCNDCKDTHLNTCNYCGKTMCFSCSKPALIQGDRGNFEESDKTFICLDCYNDVMLNQDANVRYKALVKISGEYFAKSKEYVYPYGDEKGVYIAKELALKGFKNYKPEGWKEDDSLKYYYHKDDLNHCDYCNELFAITRPSTADKNSHYCDDCLKSCHFCKDLVEISDVFAMQDRYFCKNCYNKHWFFSDLNVENKPLKHQKEQIIKQIFADNSLVEKFGVIPLAEEDAFICPESKLTISIDQTKVCDTCKERYATLNFVEDSATNTCLLCDNIHNFSHLDNKRQNLLKNSFFDTTKGKKKDFKAYCSKNTLLMQYVLKDSNYLDILHFNEKTGKYQLTKTLKDGAEVK